MRAERFWEKMMLGFVKKLFQRGSKMHIIKWAYETRKKFPFHLADN